MERLGKQGISGKWRLRIVKGTVSRNFLTSDFLLKKSFRSVRGILEDFDFFPKIHEVIRILSRLHGVGYTGESIRKSQNRKIFNTRISSQ
jgi:hypothetical protein